MAEYKVVNADELDAGLTSIGDAIREKTGGTDALAFPDEMAEAVRGIMSSFDKFCCEEHTQVSDNTSGTQTIPHGLGEVPDVALLIPVNVPAELLNVKGTAGGIYIGVPAAIKGSGWFWWGDGTAPTAHTNTIYYIQNVDANDILVNFNSDGGYYLRAGVTCVLFTARFKR